MIKNKLILAGAAFAILTSAFIFNHFLNYKNYHLSENGNWKSSKAKLAKGVVGAHSVLFTKTAFARNRLNLSSFHGYQEFLYKEPIPYSTFQFRVQTHDNRFSFIIHKNDSAFYGICFNPAGGSFYYQADGSGGFIRKQELKNLHFFSGNQINEAQVIRTSNIFKIVVNHQFVDSVAVELPPDLIPGFKGFRAYQNTYIDDVVAKDKDGNVLFSDDFTPPFQIRVSAVIFIFLLMLLSFYLFKKQNAAYALFVNVIILALMIFIYSYYYFVISSRFFSIEAQLNWEGANHNVEFEHDVLPRLEREYPLAEFPVTEKVILFIGSSQTWGAGASQNSLAMPAVIDRYFKHNICEPGFLVINAGISGSSSNRLLRLYREKWIKYHPSLTVINLSSNDADTAVFRASIRAFLETNQKNQIKTLLITEPNDVISEGLAMNHSIMKQEGDQFGVKTIDAQESIIQAENDGFIWWDYVHLTDFGQKRLAHLIIPYIKEELCQ